MCSLLHSTSTVPGRVLDALSDTRTAVLKETHEVGRDLLSWGSKSGGDPQ